VLPTVPAAPMPATKPVVEAPPAAPPAAAAPAWAVWIGAVVAA
jgi:hypothetical protein